MTLIQDLQRIARKGPPGPPPRPGLVWHEETSRWRRPIVMPVEEPTTIEGQIMPTKYKVEWVSLGEIIPEEQASIDLYVDDSGYEDINGLLRGKKKFNPISEKNLLEEVHNIEFAMKKQVTTKDLQVFRGVGKSITAESLGIGTIFQDTAFTSTSTSKDVAEEFMRGKVFLNIKIPKGTNFVFGLSKEQEVILPLGSKFRVIDVQAMPVPKERMTPGQRRRLEGRHVVSMVLLHE